MSFRNAHYVVIVQLLAMLLVGTAHAAPDTVIDFGSIEPTGTPVAEQYAADGIHIGRAADVGLPVPQVGGGCVPFLVRDNPGGGGGLVTLARSVSLQCPSGGELSPRPFGMAIAFDDERREVEWLLVNRPGTGVSAITARIDVYGAGSVLLETRDEVLAPGVNELITITRGTPEITGVVISGLGDVTDRTAVIHRTRYTVRLTGRPPGPWRV